MDVQTPIMTEEDFTDLDFTALASTARVHPDKLSEIAKILKEKGLRPTGELLIHIANNFVKGRRNPTAIDAVNGFIATQKVEEAKGNDPQIQLGLYRALEQFENELVNSSETARKATVDRATARTLTQTFIDYNAGKGLAGEQTRKTLDQMRAFSAQLNTSYVGEVLPDELLMQGLQAAADKTNPQSLEEVKPFLLLGFSPSSEPQKVLEGIQGELEQKTVKLTQTQE